jgi:arginine-tRNA-protein transferase
MSGRVSILNPLGYSASSCGYCSPPGQRSEEDTSFSTGLRPLHLTCEVGTADTPS